MGYSYSLYVESRTTAGWSLPNGFYERAIEVRPVGRANRRSGAMQFDVDVISAARGEFAWMSGGGGPAELFWGENALFPMRQGLPGNYGESPFFEYLFSFGKDAPTELRLSWLPYEELLIDEWSGQEICVGATFDCWYATLFGDGRQPFPRENLVRAGASPSELAPRERLCRESVDWTTGKNRDQLSRMSKQGVWVTWKATVAEFLGADLVASFQGLRQWGTDADLRILATYS